MRKNSKIVLALVFALVIFAAAFLLSRQAPPPLLRCTNCNVLVIGFDALQAAHVHHLGYARDTTPTLDRLAEEGYSFSRAISPASWTVPAFMSVFTATYPSVHKVVNKFTVFTPREKKLANLKELSPNIVTLAEIMKRSGYITGGFTGDAGVSGKFGYNQGFDVYTDEITFGSMTSSATHALVWLNAHKGQRFFMFFHGYDAHGQFKIPDAYHGRYEPAEYRGPYRGTREEQEKLREEGLKNGRVHLSEADMQFWWAWYDSKIRDADERLSSFLGKLQKRDVLDKTVIVVLADHGTEFYEHQRFDHGHTLYDELVHVPFIVVVPGHRGGKLISAQVTTLDIIPTLLDILGIVPDQRIADQLRGQSLLPLMVGETNKGKDVFIETDYRNYTHLRGIRTTDNWKYILALESQREELYNLAEDPGEIKNLATVLPKKTEELRRRVLIHMRDNLGQTLKTPLGTECLPVYDTQC